MIDLHIHTTYSDGLNNLKDVLIKAQKIGLNTISITDHDTTLAYTELENIPYKRIFTGNIITGIEISSKYKGYKIELLAYNFNNHKLINKLVEKEDYHTNKEMHDTIEKERIELIKKLENLNLKIDTRYKNELFVKAFESKLYNSILKNNNIEYVKEKLQDYYYDNGYKFYRKCVTSPETPFYIDYSKLNLSIDEICEIIHDNDGLVFLAHPLLYGMKNTTQKLKEMYTEYSIDGIECYYNGFTKKQIEFIKKFAHDNNLLISGGSDYHAKSGFKNELGYCMQGKKHIDDRIIENWPIKTKRQHLF